MHDRPDHHGMNDDAALGAALRALPMQAPPPAGTLPRLTARIRRRQLARRVATFGLPAALAAGLALFVAWPQAALHRDAPATADIAATSTLTRPAAAVPALASLQASSAQWQAWVQHLDRDGAPLDGRALANAVTLQDRIGLIDLQLSAARNPATSADLWQQRITLLQQLGLLHLHPWLAGTQAPGQSSHVILM